MNTKKKILIVGAGPAGLIAALGASRLGFEVELVEKRKRLEPLGGGIALQSNGLRALDTLGLLDEFRSRLIFMRGGVVEEQGGRRLASFDYTGLSIPEAKFALLRRWDLQKFLLNHVEKKEIPISFDCECVGIKRSASQVEVVLQHNQKKIADVVIACDGIHSAIRASLNLPIKTHFTGKTFLRGISPVVYSKDVITEIWGKNGERFGMGPIAPNHTYFYCSVPKDGWKTILNEKLSEWIESWAHFGPQVLEILRKVEDWKAVNYDAIQELYLNEWYKDGCFMIGDAAHAMTPDLGQGANSAMIDAVILVQMLAKHDTVERAAQEFQTLRKVFVQKIQRQSRRSGALSEWNSPLMSFARSVSFAFLQSIQPLHRQMMYLSSGYNPQENPYLVPASLSG